MWSFCFTFVYKEQSQNKEWEIWKYSTLHHIQSQVLQCFKKKKKSISRRHSWVSGHLTESLWHPGLSHFLLLPCPHPSPLTFAGPSLPLSTSFFCNISPQRCPEQESEMGCTLALWTHFKNTGTVRKAVTKTVRLSRWPPTLAHCTTVHRSLPLIVLIPTTLLWASTFPIWQMRKLTQVHIQHFFFLGCNLLLPCPYPKRHRHAKDITM